MPYTSLSYLCEETNKADAKAFAKLMEHIKKVDEEEQTVLLVQVENEPGLQGAGRENSDLADSLFEGEVPQGLVDFMKANTATMVADVKDAVENGAASGNWRAVFGDVAEEVFSSYYIASYINKVAAAGKNLSSTYDGQLLAG